MIVSAILLVVSFAAFILGCLWHLRANNYLDRQKKLEGNPSLMRCRASIGLALAYILLLLAFAVLCFKFSIWR